MIIKEHFELSGIQKYESKPTKFAYLGVGQAVPPNEIASFTTLLLLANSQRLQSALADAQDIATVIHAGIPPFNLITDLSNPNSPSFFRTDFVQLGTLELCAEAIKNAKLEHNGNIITPDFFAGHSLGSVFAAFMAGSIQDRKSLREIGAFRGKVMQKAYEETLTTLVSIQGLSEEVVADILPPYAKIGLINAPTLIAVGLPENQVEELQEYARRAGARKVTPLRTRGAFHVDMYMGRAAEEMESFLRQYDFTDITRGVFVANSDGRPLRAGKDVRDELIQSMLVPVRYPDMLRTMANVDGFIEIGPGNILSNLNILNKIPKIYTNHVKDYF